MSSPWSKMWTTTSEDGLQGWVSTPLESLPVIKAFEVSSSLLFLKDYATTHPNEAETRKKIRFRDVRDYIIPQDGIPFMAMGHTRYACQFGRDKNAARKKREEEERESRLKDDQPPKKRHCKKVPGSQKKGCQAFIHVKEVIKFTEFKGCNSEWRRKNASKRIRQALEKGEEVKTERRVFIRFPSTKDHEETHKVGQLTGFFSPLNKDLAKKLHDMVGHGVTSLREMRQHLKIHVETVLFPDPNTRPPQSNMAFFPSDGCLQNHIYAAHMKLSAMKRWVGKVALVTGASAGIGAAIARTLVRHGMVVIACARGMDKLQTMKTELEAESATGKLHPIQCDLTQKDQIAAMFKEIKKEYKVVHVCINNAGVGFDADLIDGNPEDWQTMLDLNIMALCICTQNSIKLMRENKVNDGQIIHLNSMSGHRLVCDAIYSGTKYMVTALTEGLRKDLRAMKTNIRVCAISPGVVKTEAAARRHHQDPANCTLYDNRPCLQAQDIANQVLHILQQPAHVQIHDILMRATEQEL